MKKTESKHPCFEEKDDHQEMEGPVDGLQRQLADEILIFIAFKTKYSVKHMPPFPRKDRMD